MKKPPPLDPPQKLLIKGSDKTSDDIQAALEFGSQLAQFESVPYEAKVS